MNVTPTPPRCALLLPPPPRPLGFCIRVREAVVDLARGLLRASEESAMLVDMAAAAQEKQQKQLEQQQQLEL